MSEILIIPTSSDPRYSQRTALDGIEYDLRFDYISRLGRWQFSIYSIDDEPLATGMMLLAGKSLLERRRYDLRLPQGEIFVMSADNSSPGLLDLQPGGKCRLVYVTHG
jgi:hypothetical protein